MRAPPSHCALSRVDLVLTRHREDVSWARHLGGVVCVHVYNTGPPLAEAHSIIPKPIAVPNTGREALGYLRHIGRVHRGELEPAPLTVFAQAAPHCAWDSVRDPVCKLEFVEVMLSLTSDEVDARGGVVAIGSLGIVTFGMGVPLGACYRQTWTNMTGLEPASAGRLYEALWTRGLYQPGAQFAVSRAALDALTPTVHTWLNRAESQMSVPGLLHGGYYDGNSCCSTASVQAERTCLPWLLERLWLPLFQLNHLVSTASNAVNATLVRREEPQSESCMDGHGKKDAWCDSAVLAAALKENTRRHYASRVQLPPLLSWAEKNFKAIAGAAEFAANNASLDHDQWHKVLRYLTPTKFAMTTDSWALYERGTPRFARSIQEAVGWPGIKSKAVAPPLKGDGLAIVKAAAQHQQQLRGLAFAANMASHYVREFNFSARASLVHLGHPVAFGQPSNSAVPLKWAQLLCELVDEQPQPNSATISITNERRGVVKSVQQLVLGLPRRRPDACAAGLAAIKSS